MNFPKPIFFFVVNGRSHNRHKNEALQRQNLIKMTLLPRPLDLILQSMYSLQREREKKAKSYTTSFFMPGAQLGVGCWELATPSCISYFCQEHVSNRGAIHFTLGLRPCIISSFLLQIYLRPPLKFTQLRPCQPPQKKSD